MFASWWENCDKPRQCVEKQRRYSAAKGPSSQGYGLPSHQYHCESWTIKKAEHQRIDTFKLLCWRSLLRLPWTARRSNQSILKEISPEYLLEGLMLKLQYLGHLMRRADSLEKILMLGKTEGEEGDRGCDGWMASPIHWTWTWANSGRWWGARKPGML